MIQITKNQVICDFIGEFISFEVANQRVLDGKGGYQLAGAFNKIFESSNFKDQCSTSMANCPYKSINMNTGDVAV